MNNLGLYGFNSVEIPNCDKKGEVKETNVSFNFYNRREIEKKKEKKIAYEEPEIYEQIEVLNPSLYMFKYFKPSYFNIKKINCSYNKNSLSIMNATMGEYEIPKFNKKLEFITPSGDIAQFPEKIREVILQKAKEESTKWIKSTDDPYINHFQIKNSSDSDSNN
ncbi:cell cycle associated protein, putative [Plasmodium malariae]|nr:cell cycle associated protein, putative [Plasmodium malariae]